MPALRCGGRDPPAAAGRHVPYVVNRNINFTNVCSFHCPFCAFSRARRPRRSAASPTISRSTRSGAACEEAWERGATEVCMQGGIHPDYTGETYIAICAPSRGGAAACTCTRSRRSKCTTARARSACRIAAITWRALRDARPRLAARHRGRDPRRRRARPDLPRQAERRGVDRGRRGGAPGRSPHDLDDHVRSRRDARSTGRGTCSRCAICRNGPAASPSSCRSRSCTWKRRCSSKEGARRGPTWRETAADARGRAARAPSADPEHPGLLGEARSPRALRRASLRARTTSAARS